MIRIAVRRAASGAISDLTVSGHAGYAAHGEDIVCAAVSALAQTAVLGLRHVGVPFDLDETGGQIAITPETRLDPNLAQRGQDILETTALGLAAIADTYGRYVRMSDGREEGQP